MIENVSTQLTVFHCLCPLPASRKGLRLPLRSALFWRRRQRLEAVISVDLAHHEIFHAKVGKGGINHQI